MAMLNSSSNSISQSAPLTTNTSSHHMSSPEYWTKSPGLNYHATLYRQTQNTTAICLALFSYLLRDLDLFISVSSVNENQCICHLMPRSKPKLHTDISYYQNCSNFLFSIPLSLFALKSIQAALLNVKCHCPSVFCTSLNMKELQNNVRWPINLLMDKSLTWATTVWYQGGEHTSFYERFIESFMSLKVKK